MPYDMTPRQVSCPPRPVQTEELGRTKPFPGTRAAAKARAKADPRPQAEPRPKAAPPTPKAWRPARVPSGRYQGEKWKRVPDRALAGLWKFWAGSDRRDDDFTAAVLRAIQHEIDRRGLSMRGELGSTRSVVRAKR